MPRTALLARLTTRDKAVIAAAVALLLVVAAAAFVPRGDDSDDGALAPATEEYVARTTAPGAGRITAGERAEIDRVLAAAPSRISARVSPARQAAQLLRCAEFEEQQYCLGVGWTDQDPATLARRVAASVTRAGTQPVETTGDLTTADLVARRAAMSPAERLADERSELEAAARGVAKVVLLRHQLLGEALPSGFLQRHPEARATTDQQATTRTTTTRKWYKDYPRRSTVLNPHHVREQHRTYYCGPTTMQMIAWGWQKEKRRQRHWARRLDTTSSGTSIWDMVRVVNQDTGYDRDSYAGDYIVLDISDWSFRQWRLLQMRHIKDYRAPVVLHPVLEKRFYPYLDDDASGHFQVGRGFRKRGDRPDALGYFEPWNQQRFDPSEPYIARVQWRRAYNSYRANKAHFQHNIGV